MDSMEGIHEDFAPFAAGRAPMRGHLWGLFIGSASAVVLVIDAQDDERFEEARALLLVREWHLTHGSLHVVCGGGYTLALGEDDVRLHVGAWATASSGATKQHVGGVRGKKEV